MMESASLMATGKAITDAANTTITGTATTTAIFATMTAAATTTATSLQLAHGLGVRSVDREFEINKVFVRQDTLTLTFRIGLAGAKSVYGYVQT
jgi:hypothetical protein